MPRVECDVTIASAPLTFGENMREALLVVDHLKLLVQRLGETHSYDVVDYEGNLQPVTPKISNASDASFCCRVTHPHKAMPLGVLGVALPDPDKIDVADLDDSSARQKATFEPNDDSSDDDENTGTPQAVRESMRTKIRECWGADDLKVTQSLVSAQKKIRYSNLRKTTGGLALTSSFLNLPHEMRGYMMHPQSKQRLMWTCFSLVFVAWDVFTIPLQTFKPPDSMSPWTLDLVIVLFWTFDILMSFRTGVFRQGLLIMEPRLVAKQYAFTWLFFDALVVIVEWLSVLTEATSRGFSLTRGVRMIRFVRLFRLAKLRSLLRAIEHRLPAGTFHLFLYNIKLVAILIMLVHFLACSWYGLGDIDDKGWTTVENVSGEDVSYRYFLSARWTLAQINGRTDLQRRTAIEYAFTCVVIVAAFVLVSLFISGITNAMMQINTVSGERNKSNELLTKFLDQRGVSAELAMDVKMCYKQRSRNVTNDLKVQDVLKQLPKPMLYELLQEVRAPRLKAHDLFSKLYTGYPMPFRHLCAEAVHNVPVHPDEVVFNAGEACSRMLIVDQGLLVYYTTDRHAVLPTSFSSVTDADSSANGNNDLDGGEHLMKGQWVTEAALWAFWETRGQLRSTSMCNLLSLEANDVARVMDLYKDAHALVSFYAVLYVEAIHESRAYSDVVETWVVSDLVKRVISENVSDLVAHVTSVSATQRYRSR